MAEGQSDERDINDPVRLADEVRAMLDKQSVELRAAKVPIETEPPTAYRP